MFSIWQDARQVLALQRAKLCRVGEELGSRYPEVPADIGRRLGEAQHAVRTAEEKVGWPAIRLHRTQRDANLPSTPTNCNVCLTFGLSPTLIALKHFQQQNNNYLMLMINNNKMNR